MPAETITKLDAARALLDRALAVLLDEGDYISAIVLAGSAEDVLQDLLKPSGAQSARDEYVGVIQRFLRAQYPDSIEPDPVTCRNMMRSVFNWLRHADRASDSPTITVSLRDEATACAIRATANYYEYTKVKHPREQALISSALATLLLEQSSTAKR